MLFPHQLSLAQLPRYHTRPAPARTSSFSTRARSASLLGHCRISEMKFHSPRMVAMRGEGVVALVACIAAARGETQSTWPPSRPCHLLPAGGGSGARPALPPGPAERREASVRGAREEGGANKEACHQAPHPRLALSPPPPPPLPLPPPPMAAAAEEANKTSCRLLTLPDGLLESEILRRVPEARDRAALARCCRALRRAASWYEDARVVVRYGGDPAVSLEQRWRWACHAAARTCGRLTLAGCGKEDIERLRDIAAAQAAGFHPAVLRNPPAPRELALPDFDVRETADHAARERQRREAPAEIDRLRSAPGLPRREALKDAPTEIDRRLRSALRLPRPVSAGPGATLPAAFKKVCVGYVSNPEVYWLTWQPPVLAANYFFYPEYLQSHNAAADRSPKDGLVNAFIKLLKRDSGEKNANHPSR